MHKSLCMNAKRQVIKTTCQNGELWKSCRWKLPGVKQSTYASPVAGPQRNGVYDTWPDAAPFIERGWLCRGAPTTHNNFAQLSCGCP
jgi:hypothetical protein